MVLGFVPRNVRAGQRGREEVPPHLDWIDPYDDEKLGFSRIAKYYYYPGWWEGGATGHLLINRSKWESLSKTYLTIVTTSAREAGLRMTAKYDLVNPPAMKRLITAGMQLRAFPPAIMEASFKAANETYAELAKTNARFKKILDTIMAFRQDSYSWWQVAELSFDLFQVKMLGDRKNCGGALRKRALAAKSVRSSKRGNNRKIAATPGWKYIHIAAAVPTSHNSAKQAAFAVWEDGL